MSKAKTLIGLFVVLMLLVGFQSLWAAGQQEPVEVETYKIRIGHSNMAA
ncbi:unnamed protein product, partial [marine sediment metagenome]